MENDTLTPVSADHLRSTMRFWATGVTILTTDFDGTRNGMTVSSFTSLSLDPPSVLASLGKIAATHDLVAASGVFGITILTSEQEHISNHFTQTDPEIADPFADLSVETLVTGSPFLKGGMAYFDCRVTNKVDSGTHTVFIGEVVAVKTFAETENAGPLLYYNQNYRRLKS
ncbi:MAG: flavin reductase [Chloroflexi bacterium]|nr:flavin reductase [Chloroflexota bacterium]